jgi:hypothetical protein
MRLRFKQTNDGAWIIATVLLAFVLVSALSAFSFRSPAFVGSLRRPTAASPAYDTNLIYTNLIAWWKMDEASGVRSNYVNPGTYDLTEVGTVTTTNGIVYTTSCYMERTDGVYLTTALTETNATWTYAYWFVKGVDDADWEIFAKNRTGWYCGIYPGGAVHFDIEATTYARVDASPIPSPGTTNLVVFGYDSTNIWISLNGAAAVETASTDFVPSTALIIGSEGGLLSGHNAGPVGYWERRLTADDITFLWGDGLGVKILP